MDTDKSAQIVSETSLCICLCGFRKPQVRTGNAGLMKDGNIQLQTVHRLAPVSALRKIHARTTCKFPNARHIGVNCRKFLILWADCHKCEETKQLPRLSPSYMSLISRSFWSRDQVPTAAAQYPSSWQRTGSQRDQYLWQLQRRYRPAFRHSEREVR